MSSESHNENPSKSPAAVGLAVIGGLGFTFMMLALGIGAAQGPNASNTMMGLLFFGGLVLLVFGTGGWIGVVQPHKHFDDINQPQYTGHDDH